MEKRTSQRRFAKMPGQIVGDGGAGRCACVIQDMSLTGARLGFAAAQAVPDRFDLHILATGQIRRAEIKWRRGKQVGVHFLAGGEADIGWRLIGGSA
jgi:hypothetical protein